MGNEYFRKHSYKAAAGRFREATAGIPIWRKPGCGWARRRRNARTRKDAKEAYAKYLELQPEAKDAAEIRKKIASLH